MLSAADNERITRIGPNTPAGTMLRRHWQPVALAEELAGERPARAVRLLGEDLVLFRDGGGGLGLIGRRCPHRGVDLAYGRIEPRGLRCAFHGWLFDRAGHCLEQPAEPPDSTFHRKIRHTAYSCQERNGVIFAYLGPGQAPPAPPIDAFVAPASHSFAFKGFLECNWLQALEVGIDPAHASFLHRFFDDQDPDENYGLQFRDTAGDSGLHVTRILREFACPNLEFEATDFGLRLYAVRRLDAARTHLRVTNLLFPQAVVIPLSQDMILTQWHVPVDDTHSYWYAIFTGFAAPLNQAEMRQSRLAQYELPDYKPRANPANNWGYDPAEQRASTFTGMGPDINVHDNWAVESPGPISDRTAEHLASTDRGIIMARRLLLRAIDEAEGAVDGAAPSPENPRAIDTLIEGGDWRQVWREHEQRRRAASPWAARAA